LIDPPVAPDAQGHVLITGATHGIGWAIAQMAASRFNRVTLCARNPAEVEARASSLSALGIPADVSQEDAVERLFATAISRNGPVDAVIHSAAVIGPIGPVVDVPAAEWLQTLQINLFGTFLVARAACRAMKERGGRIVLLSGGGASGPFPNYSAYASSKVAVVRFVETIALEMQPYGIEVNALAPGVVATRMHDATLAAGEAAGADYLKKTKQMLESGGESPEKAARAAMWLASGAARGISGKLVSAVYDDYEQWPEHLAELAQGELFNLRRILPRERGKDWQ
jgi:NAD(P)-dependent dehydrogenase (short-subunit alcohol dehydrogenase family)